MKAVVDAGDYFYLKRSGKFDSMPACWNNLEETQHHEISTLIASFYNDLRGDSNKEPWSIQNLKKYLNLGYVKLVDLPKFRGAYFATLGDDSVFVEPTHAVQPLQESAALLDKHDGFALKPRKLLGKYQKNCTDSKTQAQLFIHMTNHVATKHCAAALKKNERYVDLEPSAGLDVAMSDFQKSVLNPTERDVVISDLINRAQGEGAQKKEAKRKRDFVTGNVNSYSRILNDEKNLEKFKDYTELAVGLGMLNAEKDEKSKETAAKKVQEAADKVRKKGEKEAEEASKRNELLSGFEAELKEKDMNNILNLPDARMRLYIRYYFQKRIVNLTKTKKAELKSILSPLLVEYYEKAKATEDVAAAMTASANGTVVNAIGIECGAGDDAEGLSAAET